MTTGWLQTNLTLGARRTRNRVIVKLLLATTMMGTTFSFGNMPAAAQNRPVASSTQAVSFNIPSQSLTSALDAFTSQSGWQIIYSSALVRGKQSPGIQGNATPGTALSRLVAGNGIIVRISAPGSAALVSETDTTDAAAGSTTLAPILVTGEQAWGQVDGVVATRTAAGSKTDTPIIEVPQSVSVVTRDQMTRQGVDSVEGALRYTPGVTSDTMGPDTRRDRIISRSFTAKVYQDGVRMPFNATSNDGRAEAYGLERVESLRGPSSLLFGQGAPGGIIHLVSKRPTAEPLHEIGILAGNHNRQQAAFDFSGPVDPEEHILYRLTGIGQFSDTQVTSIGDDRLFIAPAVTLNSEDTSLTLLGNYSKIKSSVVPQYLPALGTVYAHPLGQISRDYLAAEPEGGYDQRSYSFGYSFEHGFNENLKLRQNLKYGHNSYEDTGAGDIYTLSLQNDLRTMTRGGAAGYRELGTLSVDTQIEAMFDTAALEHKLLAGVDVSIDRMNTSLTVNSQPAIDLFNPVYGNWNSYGVPTYAARQKQVLAGIYLQDQISIDRWRVTLGGRYDKVDSRTTNTLTQVTSHQEDGAFSGRIGVNYLFDNGVSPYASYSTSFEPVAGSGWDASPFDPTTGQQIELGVKYAPDGFNGLFTVSVFELTQQNVVTPDLDRRCANWTDPRCGNFNTQTGEVQVRGIELEARAEIADGFNLIAGYAFLDAEVTKSNSDNLGKTPVDTPRHQFSLWADYTFDNEILAGLTAGAGVRYTGLRYGSRNNVWNVPTIGSVESKIPGVTLFDASLSYDFGKKNKELEGLSLSLNASNLFDKTYVASCQSVNACFYGNGRTLSAKLGYRW